ncbi:MAG: hypothetical protein ACR2NP_11365, partial [Pirellulaceae bacterium]
HPPVPQMELDWLAEGELEREEQDRLFARLDQETDGWKQCALALLETQAVSRSIREAQLSRLPANRNEADLVSPVIAETAHQPKAGQSRHDVPLAGRWLAWATAAAMLFAAGLWLGTQRVQPPVANNDDRVRSAVVVDHQIATAIAEQDTQTLLKVNNAVQRLSVHDSEVIALVGFQQDAELVVLPIIQSALLEHQLTRLPAPSIPQETSQQLRDAGWQVQPAREFVSLHLPNGTNRVMPVNLLNYRYVGRQIF